MGKYYNGLYRVYIGVIIGVLGNVMGHLDFEGRFGFRLV